MKQAEMDIKEPTFGIDEGKMAIDDLELDYQPEPSDGLVESIQRNGILEPILIDLNGRVIEGRRRVAAARKLGIEQIPYRMLVSEDGNGVIDQATASRISLTTHATRHANVVSELHAIEALLKVGYGEDMIIRVTGMNVNTFRRRLRLRNLRPELRAQFEAGEIAPGVAEQAAKLDTATQARLLEIADGEKVTGPLVREAKQQRSQDAYEALDIPGFDNIPTTDEITRDTMVVRKSVIQELFTSVATGNIERAQEILALLLPEEPDSADD